MKIVVLVAIVATMMIMPVIAFAQFLPSRGGYTVTSPGQMPTYVTPNLNGGYTITKPGEMPSYVSPNYNGGYTVITPGKMPTYITPSFPQYPTIPSPYQRYGGND